MTLLDSPALDQASDTGTTPLRLVRAEIMKIRTTSTWWLSFIAFTVFTALALTNNGFSHHYQLYPQHDTSGTAQALAQAAQARTPAGVAAIAASMMTSGQFLGVLFAMFLGILLMTNEFAHQTATATFLTVPRRALVIAAKLTAAACFGALFWLVATVMSGVTTLFYLHSQHVSTALTGWIVVRSVLLNLLAFIIWAIIGLGLGTMIRGQVTAVVAGVAVYLGGFAAVVLIFHGIYYFYPQGWVLGAPVIAPAVASAVMITPGRAFPHAPPQWAGLMIMVGYALALTAAGIALTRHRDVTSLPSPHALITPSATAAACDIQITVSTRTRTAHARALSAPGNAAGGRSPAERGCSAEHGVAAALVWGTPPRVVRQVQD